MTEMLWKYGAIIGGLYGILLLFIYLFQKQLIFEPIKLSSNHEFDLDDNGEEVFFNTPDDIKLNALYYKQKSSDGVILYLHGNASCLTEWKDVAEDLLKFNYDIFMIDYRGYGKSEGNISEKGMYIDAKAAYDFLLEKGYSAEQIIIYGMSIGGSVALELLHEVNNSARGLILESTFASLKKLAYEKFPYFLPGLLLQYRFNNLKKAPRIKVPTLLLHGDADTTTPYQHSKLLYEALSTEKKLVIIPKGTHVDLSDHLEYRLEIESFINQLDESSPQKASSTS